MTTPATNSMIEQMQRYFNAVKERLGSNGRLLFDTEFNESQGTEWTWDLNLYLNNASNYDFLTCRIDIFYSSTNGGFSPVTLEPSQVIFKYSITSSGLLKVTKVTSVTGVNPPYRMQVYWPSKRYVPVPVNPEVVFDGEITGEQLINMTDLASLLGVTEGTAFNSDSNWLKFVTDEKTLYVAKKPIRHSLSWDHLNSLGVIDGTREITIGANRYKARLLGGVDGEYQTIQSGYDTIPTHGSEWNELMYRIHSGTFTNPLNTMASMGSAASSEAQYTDGDLGLGGLENEDWSESAKLVASDGATNNQFGNSVSISADGTTALIGSHLDGYQATYSGSAYVFIKDGSSWIQSAKLVASDGVAGDNFGTSVSISADGTTALVGAIGDDDKGTDSGSAYVFIKDGSNWIQSTKLVPTDGTADARFGISVSISADGTTALVGAYGDDDKGSYSGSAYIFTRNGSNWIQSTKLVPSDGVAGDYFGRSVSISADGTTALVGSHLDDDKGTNSGSAYIFTRDGSNWIQSTKLVPTDGTADDYFGYSVSISADGTTALVGARLDDGIGSNSGSAYVFIKDGSGWIQSTKLVASDGVADDYFGYSVSISADGTTALIGAYGDDDKGGNSGSAYVFIKDGSGWIQSTKLVASDGVADDYFGYSVSISADGTTALIGAYGDDDKGGNSGSAYIFAGAGSLVLGSGNFTLPNVGTDKIVTRGLMGISYISDIHKETINASNGWRPVLELVSSDPRNIIFEGEITGAELISMSQLTTEAGVTQGSAMNLDTNWLKFLVGNNPIYVAKRPIRNNLSYTALETLGLTSGSKELTIGNERYKLRLLKSSIDNTLPMAEPGYDPNYTHGSEWNELMYRIHSGTFTNPLNTMASVGSAASSEAQYTDGDLGLGGLENDDWSDLAKLVPTDGAANDQFGQSVSISADGTTALIAAPYDDDKGSDSGSAYIFTRNGSSWIQSAKLVPTDGAFNDNFGTSVSISADGTTALVGAYADDDTDTDSGSAYVFIKSGSSWIQSAKLVPTDGALNDRFGISVSISADGTTALIGSFLDGDKGSESGSAYIFTRNGSSWIQSAKLVPTDGALGDQFGISVSISADGTTALIGSPYDDDKDGDSGSAYIFTRNGSNWIQSAKLVAFDGAANDNFGRSVSISADGTTALVGSHLDDDKGLNSGSAYIFTRNGSNWIQSAKLVPTDGADSDYFGIPVSISADGTTALVGALNDDDKGGDNGSAYVFIKDGSSWIQSTKLVAFDGADSDRFGISVSISADGTTALVGAYLDDDKGSNSGSAYIFAGSGSLVPGSGNFTLPNVGTDKIVTRGLNGVSYSNSIDKSLTAEQYGWRPVLEYLGPK